ncbi:amidohydrolase [Thioalkalivibrio paradoxus]|uniref:amidohydrolase n=1 Tax=Thioalkalivibrio paradoxus TaxID=108010 RepID=UPI00022C2BD8|nr:amidohydrolase [Thioalkalivibrio paradoxus]
MPRFYSSAGISRRTVIKATVAGALFAASGFGLARTPGAGADTPVAKIFRGGTVVTVEEGQPLAEAVAVGGGRILAVGSEAEIMALASPGTEIVELDGATVLPGFIDAHGHFMNAPQIVGWVNVSSPPVGPVTSIPEIVTTIRAFMDERRPASGEWVIGYGYDPTVLSDGRELTRDDLDPHFPDNPVMLIHVSGHGCVLNSAGFGIVGIDENTPTPEGGVILRKEGSNEPAGLVMETAFLPIFAHMPQPSQEQLLGVLGDAQEIYTSHGVTTAQEGATNKDDLEFLLRAADEGHLVIDVVSLPIVFDVPALLREYAPDFRGGPMELPDTAAQSFGRYRNRLKLAGIKLVLDGSPQGKTAFWSEPLLTGGPEGEEDYVGAPMVPPEMVTAAVAEFVDKGIQVFSHANGDAAIDMIIDALRAAGVTAADGRRDCVIHSQFVRPDQLAAYAELGMTPSFFTAHTFFWGDVHLENTGPERAAFISPMAAAYERGLRCSNHSDFSVTPMDPFLMMQSAMLRRSRSGVVLGPDQRVDALTALRSLTIDAAWQIFEDDTKGSIAPGKLADLVIVDRNPLDVDPEQLLALQVIETFKEGESVYRRPV